MLYTVFIIFGLSSFEKYPMVNGLYRREGGTATVEIALPGTERTV
tara:strand:- start:285 stop:419 length:135 start_codon:yes stop_codon:yes gene_type:complete